MIRFDQVLSQTVNVVESVSWISKVQSVTLIRDLHGRVRLAFKFKSGQTCSQAEREALKKRLEQALGPYWGGQIWPTGDRHDRAHEALKEAIDESPQRERWLDVPSHTGVEWYKLERTFSKSSWLLSQAQPPWSLDEPDAPAIVSFYSFKGGVGRTTALAAVAILLSRAGHRVAVLDLDLEAPGLGGLLLAGIDPPEEGVVDYLLEVQLADQQPALLSPYSVTQTQWSGETGQPLYVFTAGRLNGAFLDKIARLDFEKFVTQQDNPLKHLLRQIHAEYSPDFILLDVRSGLHDLGGLSLNGLSHLDVLFGLDTPQSWDGFRVVLPILGMRARRSEVFLVHAMATPTRYDPAANERFRQRAFDLFQAAYYREDETMPDIDRDDAPYGLPIFYTDDLLNVNNLQAVETVLTSPIGPFVRLARQMGIYLQRETV
ncbi:MAG TPA: AAA family ATPase [Anaerolineae bacterium]|nr:AAA family ATPase [Anaerolineae bacterium]HQK14106.1 AAA family ATPase [Anaerolineae bacterium]